jgi:hypothetical protein
MSRLQRRRCLAAASSPFLSSLAGVAWAQAPQPDELMALAESALRQGDTAGAALALNRAAHIVHASEVEQGLVRTWMQGGDYRRALAFAAHTAGAHPDRPAGAVLYAWLLGVGGQTAAAQRTLDAALQQHSDDALRGIERCLRTGSAPAAPWRKPPTRLAPYATGAASAATSQVVASGTVVDAGRHVLVPSALLRTQRSRHAHWVRDGLGRTSPAQPVRDDIASGMTLLALEAPLADTAAPPRAPLDAYPGAPAYGVEYAHDGESLPAWPWMRAGFLGMPVAEAPRRRLGIELPAGVRGGPVFDLAGRWIGVHVRAAAGDEMLPASTLMPLLDGLGLAPASASAARLPSDQVYEQALRWAVQVLAA